MTLDLDFLTDEEIYQRIMKEDIPLARRSVLIATALVKQTMVEVEEGEYHPFLKIVSNLVGRGVKVFLIFAGKLSRPFLKSLNDFPDAARGMEMILCVRNHMKIVLIDNEKLYLGSANLTGAGMGHKDRNKRNFEFGFFTKDVRLIKSI